MAEAAGRGAPVRVVVVDDDPVERAGRAVLVTEAGGTTLVGAVSPDEALAWPEEAWHRVDVVLLDVWDSVSTAFDRYRGVAVARRIRSFRPTRLCEVGGGPQLTIVAVSRHMPNSLLNKRLVEAGVDLRFDRDDPAVREPQQLAVVLSQPERFLKAAGRAWEPDGQAEALGAARSRRLNDLVELAATGTPADLFRSARRYRDNKERMRWARVVARVAEEFELSPRAGSPRGGPHRRRGVSISDLRTVLDVCRGAERPPPPRPSGDAPEPGGTDR